MSNNPAKYEVLIKQYLRSILDISGPVCLSFLTGKPLSFIGCVLVLVRLFTQQYVVGSFFAERSFSVTSYGSCMTENWCTHFLFFECPNQGFYSLFIKS